MSTKEKHLYYLTELKDYKVNSKDPDIRGWQVKDFESRVIGKVDNLLVNKELGKVVYVDVEVDQSIIDAKHDPYMTTPDSQIKEFINKDGENHIIIPIGLIDLNTEDKFVFTDSIDYQTFSETKRYSSGSSISREYERNVLDSYDRRKDYRDRDHLLRRESSAFTDVELADRARRSEDAVVSTHNETETEERIRREKENLRYKSDDRKDPVPADNSRYREEYDLEPERTLDEEEDWIHMDTDVNTETSYERKHRKKYYDDDFYDREEFLKREYR